MKELQKIPYQGVGMGLRHQVAEDILAYKNEIDIVEIISEHFFSHRIAEKLTYLENVQKHFPISPHGVMLSIGSATPVETNFLEEIKSLVERVDAHYYSDHFCLTQLDPLTQTGHLTPLWYTREMVDHVADKIKTIQDFTNVPLLLENITAPFTIPEADFEEPEFITEVCRRSECGLLLDVTNVFINARNEAVDAQSVLERFPMEHVTYIHLAGGAMDEHGIYHDTHSARVPEEVWPLYEWAVENSNTKTVIIERDQDFEDDFENMVLEDIRRARRILTSKVQDATGT